MPAHHLEDSTNSEFMDRVIFVVQYRNIFAHTHTIHTLRDTTHWGNSGLPDAVSFGNPIDGTITAAVATGSKFARKRRLNTIREFVGGSLACREIRTEISM
jgi:hypothetical protein